MVEQISRDTHPVLLGREVSSHGRFAFIHELLAHPETLRKNPKWLEKQYNILVKIFDKPLIHERYNQTTIQNAISMDSKFLEATIPEFLPKYAIVQSGQNKENSMTYMVIEKIYPKPINKENVESFYKQLDDLLSKALSAFITRGYDREWKRGFFPDLKPDNVVFGSSADDTKDKLYLIDLFPVLHITARQAILDVSNMTGPYSSNYSFPLTQEKILILNTMTD
jgi:hypothetical protein